ncbi:hypothetical protein Pmani_031662 [Petrolisthes manimaculis]|uniref:Uncharacterized protein n=1 Tax=Petrolisthes manimaculis TaxID=1843537 RepID=A0AAE1NUP0_9EUCA|nr:hypothetical protein Pmani_031662 [Petrolisthes manimaculis]
MINMHGSRNSERSVVDHTDHNGEGLLGHSGRRHGPHNKHNVWGVKQGDGGRNNHYRSQSTDPPGLPVQHEES